MTYSTELRQRLEAGIEELEGEIARLRAAIVALDGRAATTDSARAARTGRGRPRAGKASNPAAPVYQVVPAGKLATLLSGSDGFSTAELAQQTHGAPDQVLQLLKELEQAGRAHRSGTRRSTRWHPGPGRPAATVAAPGDSAA